MRRPRPMRIALATVASLAVPAAATAATPLESLDVSPDVTILLPGTAVTDRDVAEDDLAGSVLLLDLGDLPAGADVDAFEELDDGARLFSLDVTVLLDGVAPRPGDVVRDEGGALSLAFRAADAGLPAGADVDAVATAADGGLLLSFDTTLLLPAGGTAADEDLVRVDPDTGALFPFFDGSASGVPGSLDLDGARRLASNGHLLLSFDSSGSIGGVAFDDEDVLEHDPVAGTWEVAYRPAAAAPSWAAADLDALGAREAGGGDLDGDGRPDAADNCPLVPNPGQADGDGDGIGDLCECGDATGDGLVDARDARSIQRCAIGAIACTALCDATGDGACNAADARRVQRFAVGDLGKGDLACDQRASPP